MAETTTATITGNEDGKATQPQLGALEEDDEFEEFEAEDWGTSEEDPQEAEAWENDWDDDDVEDDFSLQLKEELAKASQGVSSAV
ncbi:hypothetical protein BZG36_02471 [Bifiguratus adelaidae]|uniref:26S proteasome complex subunit SEM1 n=1 Tax=Bifiguratus adelaidae TaxID=1938954 RepID=A0A261Y0W0_9FUNG|nr:hypothetical protein BZG36_02471 [Bifiguratus adelaidae]